MSEFEEVGPVEDFPDGTGVAVPVDGRMVAVFRNGDSWHAIDDLCPHMGASLAEGYFAEGCVACPWHAWRFSVETGKWEDNPNIAVEVFEVKVEDDQVLVRVPE